MVARTKQDCIRDIYVLQEVMGYVVVQFTRWKSGTSALAVPESWLFAKGKELICYFPKSNAAKLIEQEATPRGDWKTYPVRRLSMKTIPNYDKALRKESEARFTSGVDTDSDSGEANGSCQG